MHMPIWHTANIEIRGITRNIEFSLSIPTFHCHILVPRQGSHKSCTEEGNVDLCQPTQVPELLQALEFLQKNWWAEVAAARNLEGFKSGRSVSQVARQCLEIRAEFSRKSRAGGKKNPMAFVCNSNAMNRQITCKMLLMEMCIMDVHNQERREGIWIQALLLKFESGCIQEIKSRESMEVKDLRFCCWKGGFGKEGVVVEWLSVW